MNILSMLLGVILVISFPLGFAYIIWVFAAKETKATKLIGQIIAIVIAVAVILILISGLAGGPGSKCPMGSHMMGPQMMQPGMVQQSPQAPADKKMECPVKK